MYGVDLIPKSEAGLRRYRWREISIVFQGATARLARISEEVLARLGEAPISGGHWTFFVAWALAAAGTAAGLALYWKPLTALPARLARTFPGAYQLWVDKFRVDELYELLVLKPFEWLSYVLWRVVDVGLIDGIVNGVGRGTRALGSLVRLFQNGDVQRYAALMAVAAAIILGVALGMGGLQ